MMPIPRKITQRYFTFGLEYLWVIFLGIGIICLLGYFVARNVKKVQLDSARQGAEGLQTAEEFLKETAEVSEGRYPLGDGSRKDVLVPKLDGQGLSGVLREAIKMKLNATVMESKLRLNLKAPLRVRGNELFVDVEDGEVGEIVIEAQPDAMKEKEKPVPPTANPPNESEPQENPQVTATA